MIEMLTPKTPNMKTTKKIKIQLLGETFELPATAKRNDKWYDGDYIYLNAKYTASVIKQYVKKKYGNRLTVWSTSDVYSGGSSVRVQIWSKNGSPAPYEFQKDIQSFANSLKAGSFNGMEDIYEYNDEKLYTDNGTRIAGLPSYIFVENRPQWDTPEYWLNEWKTFDESNYDNLVGDTTWEKFVNRNSRFWKKGTLEKLTKYMNELHEELISLGYTEEELAA
jgi:hypothetical protein